MIAAAVFLAFSAFAIAALAYFWRDIVEWIQKAIKKISEFLNAAIEGVKTFLARTHDGLKKKSKYYNRNKLTGEWEETVLTKSVDESEIPPELLRKAAKDNYDDVSITDELKLILNS